MVQITFTGFDGSSVDIDVEQADTVGSLRPRLAELLGVDATHGRCRVKLTKGLNVLDDSDPVPTWALGAKESLGYALIQRNRLAVATSRWQRPLGGGLAAPSAMLRVFDADVSVDPVDVECGGLGIMVLAKISDGFIASTDPHDAAVVSVWNTETGERHSAHAGHAVGTCVTSLCALDGEGSFATGGEDTEVRIWGTKGETSEQVLSGHECSVYALATLEAGILASGCSGNSIRIWDVEQGESVSTVEGAHAVGSWVHSLAPLDSGVFVSCTDGDPDVKVWDKRSVPSCVLHCSGHRRGPVQGAWAVCAAGQGFASGGVDGVVRMWDVRQAAEPYRILDTAGGIADGGVEHLSVLRDSLFGTKGDAVYKWSMSTGAMLSTFECPGKAQAMCIY